MSGQQGGVNGGRRRLGLVLGLLVAGVALALLIRNVDWRAAWGYVRQVELLWLLLGLVALLLNNGAKAQRWRMLFPPGQPLPGRGEAFGALMAGQLLNFILAFRSGDLSRIYFMGRYRGASSAAAAGTVGAEKLLDLVILGGLFALVLPRFVLPEWVEASKASVWALSLLALALWIGVIVALPPLQRLLARMAGHWPLFAWPLGALSRLLDGFAALRSRQRLGRVLFWTALAWAGSIAASWLIMESLALPATLALAILANVIVQGGLSVPVAPAGIGVFEWLAILALSLGGIPPDQGLAYGLLMHAAVLFFPVVVGLPWLLTRFR
jgi:uncharacterized protein (TIRG00374 family)